MPGISAEILQRSAAAELLAYLKRIGKKKLARKLAERIPGVEHHAGQQDLRQDRALLLDR